MVDFEWAFKANTNGEYQGNGFFLDHVTTVLGDIYAAWGFSVDVKATASTPYNAGTLASPIAVQELQVSRDSIPECFGSASALSPDATAFSRAICSERRGFCRFTDWDPHSV